MDVGEQAGEQAGRQGGRNPRERVRTGAFTTLLYEYS
jgi:hypothetical protein